MHNKHVCMLPEQAFCSDAAPTAGCCRSKLANIQLLMLPCEWHHGTTFYYRSKKNLLLERHRQLQGPFLLWHPYSPIKFYWDCFLLILNLIVFVYMPFQVFFVCPNRYDPLILFSDIVTALDVCTKFITGYKDEDSKLVILNRKEIANKYLRGIFIFDIIGALPLQIYEMHKNCEHPTHTVMFLFKLARLFSIRLAWINVYQQFRLPYVSAVAMAVIVRVILFFHWMTYIHYQVPALFTHYYDRNILWGRRFKLSLPSHEYFQKYVTNFYWVCGLCVGAGYYSPVEDYVVPDLILTSVIEIIGLFFIIHSFTTLLRLFIYGQYDKYMYNGRFYELEEYMNLKRLPNDLRKKIKLFLNYKFTGSYFNEAAILNTINEQIKQDINMHFCKRLVMNIPTFQNMPVAFVNAVIFSLVQVLFMPGEMVVSIGEFMDCLYLIYAGTVAVLDSFGKEVGHLRDGAYFGEAALRGRAPRRGTAVVAREITEMYKLTSEAYSACLRFYPQLAPQQQHSTEEAD